MAKKPKKVSIFLIYELHNGVEPRLLTGYLNRKSAYKKADEWNNREDIHSYYVREFEVWG